MWATHVWPACEPRCLRGRGLAAPLVLPQYSHPFFWAPFILVRYVIGDPDEPTIHRAIVAGGWKPKGLRAQVHYCGEHAHLLKGAAA
jgi:hypothetical protein